MADKKATQEPEAPADVEDDVSLEQDDTPLEEVLAEAGESEEETEAEAESTEDEPDEGESEEDEADPEQGEPEAPEGEQEQDNQEESEAPAEPGPTDDPAAAKRAFDEREAKRQAAKEAAQQKYLDEAEDEHELSIRQLKVDSYNNRVENNVNKLQNGVDKALANIDLFKSGTPEEKNALLDYLDDFERIHVVKDQNGDPIRVTGDVFEYLTNKADSIKRLTRVGARQGKQDRSNTRSRTITPPGNKPKEDKKQVDPAMEAFDEEAARP